MRVKQLTLIAERHKCSANDPLCSEGSVRYCAQCDHWFCNYHWGEGTLVRCMNCRRENIIGAYTYPAEDACESCGGVGHHYRTCWRSGGATTSPCPQCEGSGASPDVCFYSSYIDPESPCSDEMKLCARCKFWYCEPHWGAGTDDECVYCLGSEK